jgi:thioredoxin 2
MSEQVRQVVCVHCNAVNCVPAEKPAAEAKCGRCHKPLFTRAPAAIDPKSFPIHVQRSDIPVVVDFWAEWCGPCKAMAPAYERVAAELEPNSRFLKVDTEAAPDLSATYDIRSIPTLMIFQRGAVKARRSGAMDAGTLRSWVMQHTQ